MSDTRGYGSPAAFRRALTDKLGVKAETSRWTLAEPSVRWRTSGCLNAAI
jgi:hypothetical protein